MYQWILVEVGASSPYLGIELVFTFSEETSRVENLTLLGHFHKTGQVENCFAFLCIGQLKLFILFAFC